VLNAADQEFELGDLLGESGVACLGKGDPGAGAPTGIALLDGDQPGVLQHAQVLGQVAGAQFQVGPQVAELAGPAAPGRERQA